MASEKSDSKSTNVNVRELPGNEKTIRRTFPGPRDAAVKLRVAIDRAAYAELVAHAKSSLAAEVCGVLVGNVCRDDEGNFVHVEAVIRGAAASQANTHVTFTQETWNSIHKVLEQDYPKLKIVGWYHTHPGFGVEFSEMDLFIQRNFFSGPTHLALVTDPVNGDVAICINTPDGIQYLDRFWVDGREQQCRAPNASAKSTSPSSEGDSDRLRALEERVGQLVQALDDTRNFHHRFMLACGFIFCLALIVWVGYSVYSQWGEKLEPPKVNQIVPVPIQIGDQTVILGVGITSWQVPPELNAIMLQAEMLQRAKAAEEAAKTNAAAMTNTNKP